MENQELAAQSVVKAEDGSVSLVVQTVSGEKFSCPLTKVEVDAEQKGECESDKTDTYKPEGGEVTTPATPTKEEKENV
jgi:hypothetical protein